MMQRAAQPAKPVLSMAGRTTARVADTMRRGTARARAAVGRQVGRARDFLRGTAGEVGPGAACAVRCFAAGTLVLTPSGYLAIDEVEVGDYVLSQSEDGEAAFRRVEATWERVLPVTELTVVSADGDEVALRVTAEHPFYVEGEGWTEVGDLALGDLLVGTDGELLEVVGLHATDDVEVVYNLTVEGFHTYFVFDEHGVGVWSHNCGDGIDPRDFVSASPTQRAQVLQDGLTVRRGTGDGLRIARIGDDRELQELVELTRKFPYLEIVQQAPLYARANDGTFFLARLPPELAGASGEGTRILDFVLVDHSGAAPRALGAIETTGPNVDKTLQLARESAIRAAGGRFVRARSGFVEVPLSVVSHRVAGGYNL